MANPFRRVISLAGPFAGNVNDKAKARMHPDFYRLKEMYEGVFFEMYLKLDSDEKGLFQYPYSSVDMGYHRWFTSQSGILHATTWDERFYNCLFESMRKDVGPPDFWTTNHRTVMQCK